MKKSQLKKTLEERKKNLIRKQLYISRNNLTFSEEKARKLMYSYWVNSRRREDHINAIRKYYREVTKKKRQLNPEEYNEYMRNYFQTKKNIKYRQDYYRSKQNELREYRRRRYWINKIGEDEVNRIGLENLGNNKNLKSSDIPIKKRKDKVGMIINSLPSRWSQGLKEGENPLKFDFEELSEDEFIELLAPPDNIKDPKIKNLKGKNSKVFKKANIKAKTMPTKTKRKKNPNITVGWSTDLPYKKKSKIESKIKSKLNTSKKKVELKISSAIEKVLIKENIVVNKYYENAIKRIYKYKTRPARRLLKDGEWNLSIAEIIKLKKIWKDLK